jgi:hypothetical protein
VAPRKKVYTVKYPIDLAVDPGNGTTCVVTERADPLVFPSVIQRVEDVRLDERGTQGFTIHVERLNEQTGDYQDRKSWAIGDTANLLPGLKTRITSKDRIGSEYQLVLILAGTVRALDDMITSRADEIKVNAVWWLNAPPIYYRLAPRLYDLAGEYRVEYNRRVYRLSATVGHVYPEGAGAAACYMLGTTGQFLNPVFATGHTGVVDGGYRTIDSAIFEGPALLETSAYSLTGSISDVYRLMQMWAMDEFGEDWTEQECETNLRYGHAVLRETKERVDLADWIDELGERLAALINADIFQKQWNGLGDVDRVILAGGVAYMVAHHLKERYPNVIILREDYPHTATVPYELMNATGHIRLLLAERAEQG